MLHLYTLLTAHILGARDAVARRLDARSETGLGTLEIVIIALGLFTIAGAAVAVISGAVESRLSGIN